MIFTKLNKILEAGIYDDTDETSRKKIHMTNQIAFFFAVSALIYTIVFAVCNAPLASLFLLGFFALFLSVSYFNFLNKYTLARVVLMLSLYSGITFFRALLGPDSLVDLIFISVMAVPFAISDKTDSRINWAAFILSVSLFSVCRFTPLIDSFALAGVSEALQYPVAIFVFVMPFIIMNRCKKEQNNHETELDIRAREINLVNYELTQTNKVLEHTVDNLQETMKERDVLLKEIHHRVKNNMQIISSLLNLQATNIEDAHIKSIFKCSQMRIGSMAMVHEMLYKSHDLSKIEFSEYITNLVPKLVCSYKGLDHEIQLDLNVPRMYFSIDTAVPLGLMINEIISNSLKHGFNGSNAGKLHLSIINKHKDKYLLQIGDDGIGMNGNRHKSIGTLGLMLIDDLADQLNGNVSHDRTEDQGTHYKISFSEVKPIILEVVH